MNEQEIRAQIQNTLNSLTEDANDYQMPLQDIVDHISATLPLLEYLCKTALNVSSLEHPKTMQDLVNIAEDITLQHLGGTLVDDMKARHAGLDLEDEPQEEQRKNAEEEFQRAYDKSIHDSHFKMAAPLQDMNDVNSDDIKIETELPLNKDENNDVKDDIVVSDSNNESDDKFEEETDIATTVESEVSDEADNENVDAIETNDESDDESDIDTTVESEVSDEAETENVDAIETNDESDDKSDEETDIDNTVESEVSDEAYGWPLESGMQNKPMNEEAETKTKVEKKNFFAKLFGGLFKCNKSKEENKNDSEIEPSVVSEDTDAYVNSVKENEIDNDEVKSEFTSNDIEEFDDNTDVKEETISDIKENDSLNDDSSEPELTEADSDDDSLNDDSSEPEFTEVDSDDENMNDTYAKEKTTQKRRAYDGKKKKKRGKKNK